MTSYDSSVELSAPGEFHLSEPGEKLPTRSLVNSDSADLILRIDTGPGNGKNDCNIGLSGYYVENTETGRLFNAGLQIGLTWDQIDVIYKYLGFLIAAKKDSQ